MDKLKMFFLKLTEAELKVVEYTDAKIAWGPTTDQMDDLVQRCKNPQEKKEILNKLFQLMKDEKSNWKTVYKCLLTIEHMTYYADYDCVKFFRDNASFIERLKDNYRFRDDEGCDKGINVRKRAELVHDLILDEHLGEKRDEAQRSRIKYGQHAVSNQALNQFQNPNYAQTSSNTQSYQSKPQPTIQSQPQQPQQQSQPVQQQPVQQTQLPVFKQSQPPTQQLKPTVPQMRQFPAMKPIQPQQPQQQVVEQKQEEKQEQQVEQQQVEEKKTDFFDDLFGTPSQPAQQQPAQQQSQQIDLFGEQQQVQQPQQQAQSNNDLANLLDF